MIRLKIKVFGINSKAKRVVLYRRTMEVSDNFCLSLLVDHYYKVYKTFYPNCSGVEFLFM